MQSKQGKTKIGKKALDYLHRVHRHLGLRRGRLDTVVAQANVTLLIVCQEILHV